MRYGLSHRVEGIESKLIEDTLSLVQSGELKDSKIVDPTGFSKRSSVGMWISDRDILNEYLLVAQYVNRRCGWDFEIDEIEPLQYTEYYEGGEFDWHVDQHSTPYSDNRVRKVSFSIILNDDFNGGDFDLETGNPNKDVRYDTIDAQKGQGVFFQSDYFHRVRPVTGGVRKSLVGWVLGPKFL